MAALADFVATGWIWVTGGVGLGEGVVHHAAYCWNVSRFRSRLVSGGEILAKLFSVPWRLRERFLATEWVGAIDDRAAEGAERTRKQFLWALCVLSECSERA